MCPPKRRAVVAPPPPVGGPTEEELWAEIQQVQGREDVVQLARETVVDVLETVDTIVREKYYKGLLVPFVLQEMTSQLFGVVETLFISHDPGAELCTEPEQWALEREPEPMQKDSWARGVLEVQAAQVPREPTSPEVHGRPGSSGSSRPGSRTSNADSRGRGVSTVGSRTRLIRTQEFIPLPGSKPTSADSSRQRRVRKERGKNGDQIVKNLDKEELAQLDKIQRELRGKDYSYDANGNIYLISRLNPSTLPSSSVNTKVRVAGGPGQKAMEPVEPDANAVRRRARRPPPRFTTSTGAAILGGVSGGPMVQALNLAQGVTLRSQDARALAGNAASGAGGAGNTTSTSKKAAEKAGTGKKGASSAGAGANASKVNNLAKLPPTKSRGGSPLGSPRGTGPQGTDGPSSQRNIEDMHIPSSGAPLRPRKITDQERAQIIGDRKLNPRDRRYNVSVSGGTASKRLPPPVYPASRGHGFVKGNYLAQQNPYASSTLGDEDVEQVFLSGTQDGSVYGPTSARSAISSGSLNSSYIYKRHFDPRQTMGVVRTVDHHLMEDLDLVDVED